MFFILIYPESSAACSHSAAAPFTLAQFRTLRPGSCPVRPVWCQSAAPSEQSAVKHLAQGHLNRSVEGAKKRVSFASRVQILLAPPVTSLLFEFLPRGRCSTNFPVSHFPPVYFPTLNLPLVPIILMVSWQCCQQHKLQE